MPGKTNYTQAFAQVFLAKFRKIQWNILNGKLRISGTFVLDAGTVYNTKDYTSSIGKVKRSFDVDHQFELDKLWI